MKTLKFTLLVAVLFATLSSCTKQDLNEDDLLIDQTYAEGGDTLTRPTKP